MNLIQLPPLPPDDPQPDLEVVEMLESLLTRARSGHVTTLAFVTHDCHSGETLSCLTGKLEFVRVLGALEFLKHRIACRLMEGTED